MSTIALNAAYPAAVHPNPMSPARPRLRLTRRGRRVLLVLATAPIVLGIALLALSGGDATATGEAGTLDYVTVAAGQSLWSIAEQLQPQSDPRDVIEQIVALNGLDSTTVLAGQRLAVPAGD
ncbi:MAG: LysM peptidoglycan-binding domain-containing protein [Microbacteriaceae bacterium]